MASSPRFGERSDEDATRSSRRRGRGSGAEEERPRGRPESALLVDEDVRGAQEEPGFTSSWCRTGFAGIGPENQSPVVMPHFLSCVKAVESGGSRGIFWNRPHA